MYPVTGVKREEGVQVEGAAEEVQFEDTSTLEAASTVSGKINESVTPGKITSSQKSDTSSFLSSSQNDSLSPNLLDDDDDVKWKIFSFYSSLKKRKWFKTFRSPVEFCSTSNFSRPESRKDLTDRIGINSKYFFTNYIILCVLLLSYSIITKPTLVLCMGAFVWMYMYASNHDEVKILRIPIKGKLKFGILGCLAIFVFVWLAGNTIVFTLSLCAFVIFVHMLFHSSVNPEDVDADFDPLDQLELP